MRNKDVHQSCGPIALTLFLLLLGLFCIGLITSDPWGFMGFSAAIVIGGIGLLLSPFVFLIGRQISKQSTKGIFDLDFSDSPNGKESEENEGP